jgi:hypothetical protein
MDSEIGLPGKGARKSGASPPIGAPKMAVGNCPSLMTGKIAGLDVLGPKELDNAPLLVISHAIVEVPKEFRSR